MEQNAEKRIYVRILIGLIALMSLLIGYFGFPSVGNSKTEEPQTIKEVELTAQPLHQQDISVTAHYIGYVTPIHAVNVVPKINGYLQDIFVSGGQEVKSGDNLLMIQQNEYKAALAAASAAVAKAQADFNNASTYFQRIKKTPAKAVSQTEFDSAKANYLSSLAALEQAKANQDSAQINLEYTILQAPISGIIGNVDLTPGNYVSPSSSPLLKIIQYNPIRVVFSITDKEYLQELHKNGSADLYQNERIYLRLANQSLYKEEGKFRFTDNEINKSTNSISVYADFANPNKELVANAYVDVLIDREFKGAYLIPQKYVEMTTQGNFIYTVKNNTLYKNKIDTSVLKDGNYVISGAFSPQEYLVTEKVGRFPSGSKVKVKVSAPE